MSALTLFFIKYLLAPILVVIALFVMKSIAKAKGALKMKPLIIFILLLSLLLTLPSLLGFLKYEFVWNGLLLSIIIYLIIGCITYMLSHKKMIKKIGIAEDMWLLLLAYFIATILASWLYYLVFTFISGLDYGVFAMTTTLWFFMPILYMYGQQLFDAIPSAFYDSYIVDTNSGDEDFWSNIDTFRLMQVTIKLKKQTKTESDSSLSVKIPKEVTIGAWFNRFVTDQNLRFPGDLIELELDNNQYGWIFYAHRWLPFPLFIRRLDFTKTVKENRIKNKSIIYAKRVVQNS